LTLRGKNFDGDFAFEFEVSRAIDRAHAAAAEFAVEAVAFAQNGAERQPDGAQLARENFCVLRIKHGGHSGFEGVGNCPFSFAPAQLVRRESRFLRGLRGRATQQPITA
jgi:hypothetical protein